MVMETAPPAPLIIAEAEFLLQLLIVALDAPAQLDEIDQTLKRISSGSVASQYLVGSASSCSHSISSHSSARGSLSLVSRCAGRTRCRANRDDSQSAVPSRQVMVCQASLGRLRASAFTAIG